MIKIAFDVMGGDFGVSEAVEGANRFIKDFDDVHLTLFGNAKEIEKTLIKNERITVEDCKEVITMEDKAMAFRTKPDASMIRAIKSVKTGDCDAVMSSGSTGTYLTSTYLMLRTIKGIERPGLCVLFPNVVKGNYKVVMDIGANTDNDAKQLFQFAHMGSIYAEAFLGKSNPRVALLSNGTEEKKGPLFYQEAYKMIKEEGSLNFIGNVEGKTVLDDDTDVLVCDGWAGNVLMKSLEGTAKGMNKIIKQEITKGPIKTLGALLVKSGFKKVKKRLSSEEIGGSIMLGLNNVAVKAQGASKANGYYGGLRQTYKLVKADIITKVKEKLANE